MVEKDEYYTLALNVIHRFCQDSVTPTTPTVRIGDNQNVVLQLMQEQARAYIRTKGFVDFCGMVDIDGLAIREKLVSEWNEKDRLRLPKRDKLGRFCKSEGGK